MRATYIQRRPAYSRSTSYSRHQSNYRGARQPSRFQQKKANRHGHVMVGLVLTMVVGVGVVIGFKSGSTGNVSKTTETPVISAQNPQPQTPAAVVAPAPATNQCASNTMDKFIKVSTSQKHLWACEGNKLVFDAAVITGIDRYEETVTPPGTYKVYNKQTDQVLTGKDSAGSWKRPVKYWMPFLHNEHGVYGFHDADWRPVSEFGTIDPSSDKGSHGCVELTVGASKWLYDWAPTHTTLTVES